MASKRKKLEVKLESTCEGWTGKRLYLNLIPEDGEEALVIVSDEKKSETKLFIRRVHYDENSITLERSGKHPEMIFTGDERKNIMIVGRVEEPGHIVLCRPEMQKPVAKNKEITDSVQIADQKGDIHHE